jgi:hypothetical protein
MSTQNHSGTFGAGYMARIAKLAPAAKAVKQLQVLRSKRHSIDDARKAVADKLLANLAYLRDPNICERPDLVYKEQEPGVYVVGIKYGNRWLNGLFEGGTYLQGLTADALGELLEGFAQDALSGQFDAYIRPIMDANIAARSNAKH